MSAQSVLDLSRTKPAIRPSWFHRLGLFTLFLACGLAILVFGSKYFAVFPTNNDLAYQAFLSALFLVAAVWLKRDERLNQYWQIAFAFFIASFAISVTLLIGGWSRTILGWFNVTASTSQWTAIEKVIEMLMVVVPIIVLTKLSGTDLGSIYLKWGNLKWGFVHRHARVVQLCGIRALVLRNALYEY